MAEVFAKIFGSDHEPLKSTGPLYLKLRQILEHAIQNNILQHGEALPPERDLADQAGVSRVTVRKAVDDLVKDGLLVRRHGSGTFVEKPVTLSAAGAVPISEASAAKPELVCTVGQVLRWFPMYRRAHELVKAGEIGLPAALRMSRGGGLPGAGRGWFEDHSKSGGVFIDLGVHDFDFLLWTFGPVVEVVARSVGAKTGSGADYGLATLTLASGAVAHVESTWMDADDPGMAFEFCGSEGMLQWDSRSTGTVRGMGRVDGHFMPDDDPFFGQMKEFVTAIREGRPAAVGLRDAVAAVRVAEAALESARTGLRVTL